MSASIICISTIAERYYRRDYQAINAPAFFSSRRKGVERQKRLVRSSPIFVPYRVFSVARLCISIFGRGLIAAFLIMTLMSDAYLVSGGPDRWRTRPASSRLESGIGPTWRVVEPIKNKSDSSPSSLALSLFSFFSVCLSASAKTDLSPTLIPIVAHAYRVLVWCERKDWKKRGPFACLFILSKGRDAFSATFFAGYWTRQMSQRTFSERLLKRHWN